MVNDTSPIKPILQQEFPCKFQASGRSSADGISRQNRLRWPALTPEVNLTTTFCYHEQRYRNGFGIAITVINVKTPASPTVIARLDFSLSKSQERLGTSITWCAEGINRTITFCLLHERDDEGNFFITKVVGRRSPKSFSPTVIRLMPAF